MYHGRLTPYVRFAKTIRRGPDYPKPLYAYDHRLIYMLEGDMGLVFEKQSYRLSRDSVAVFPPALAYKLMDNRKEGNEYVILNFDFHDARRGTTPHPPDDAKSFRSEEIFSAESFPPFHKPVVLERAEYLRSPLHEICREEENGLAYAEECMSGLMKHVLLQILRQTEEHAKRPTSAEWLALQIRAYIEANYASDLTNQSVARMFGYHPYYINSLFVKFFHETFHGFIISTRLRAAKNMLLDSYLGIGEIARACGFGSDAYFSECFKKHFGIRPGEFRNRSK